MFSEIFQRVKDLYIWPLLTHHILGSVQYQSQTSVYTRVSLIAGVYFADVFMRQQRPWFQDQVR